MHLWIKLKFFYQLFTPESLWNRFKNENHHFPFLKSWLSRLTFYKIKCFLLLRTLPCFSMLPHTHFTLSSICTVYKHNWFSMILTHGQMFCFTPFSNSFVTNSVNKNRLTHSSGHCRNFLIILNKLYPSHTKVLYKDN